MLLIRDVTEVKIQKGGLRFARFFVSLFPLSIRDRNDPANIIQAYTV